MSNTRNCCEACFDVFGALPGIGQPCRNPGCRCHAPGNPAPPQPAPTPTRPAPPGMAGATPTASHTCSCEGVHKPGCLRAQIAGCRCSKGRKEHAPSCGASQEALTVEPNSAQLAGRFLKMVSAAQIQMRASRWLWAEAGDEAGFTTPGGGARWLPLGGLALLGGREGTGKSTWAYHLAAQVTAGRLPGDLFGKPASVVVVATEDAWAETILPRLVAAGADREKVFRVDAVEQGHEMALTLPADVAALADLCQRAEVALVLLDPLMGAISGTLDTHKDAELRRALEPLSRMAHELRLTILGLIHVNKSTSGDLLTRIMGSRAFSAVARAVLFAAKEVPEGDAPAKAMETYWLGQIKNNLAAKVPYTLRYRIEGMKVGRDDELLADIWSSRIVVDGRVTQRVDEIVNEQETRLPERETAADRAAKWLRIFLAGRGPVPSADVKAAAEQVGHSERTIKRALVTAEVKIAHQAGNATTWELPTTTTGPTGPTGPTGLDTQNGTNAGVGPVGPAGQAPARGGPDDKTGSAAGSRADTPVCEGCGGPLMHPRSIERGRCERCQTTGPGAVIP